MYPGNEPVARSYALRLLIHFLGDIAQPFHSTSRFNDNYPDGDAGANAFPIPYHYEADEMHAVWDKGVYTLRGNYPRPISAEDWAELQNDVVDPYMATYIHDMSDGNVANIDFDSWSWEGHEKAKSMYTGATENEPLPQEYLDLNVPRCEDDITLGGYRLAYVMTFIYDVNLPGP